MTDNTTPTPPEPDKPTPNGTPPEDVTPATPAAVPVEPAVPAIPTPYVAAPTDPAAAAAPTASPGTPAAPGTPGAAPAGGIPPQPPKKRTPLWMWLSGALVLMLIAVLVIVSIVRGNEPEASSAIEPTTAVTVSPSADPSDAESDEPAASTAPSSRPEPTSSSDAVDLGEVGDENGYISLDTFADFGGTDPAMWGFPTPDGWEMTVFGEEGQSQIVNETLSCSYQSLQSRQPAYDATATSDLADTTVSLTNIESTFTSQFLNASITKLDNVNFSWGVPGSDSKMEFLASRMDYERADTGELYSTLIFVRATPQMEGLLYATINCPTTTFGSATDPTQGLIDGTTVTPSSF
jgi:hypothetical protein